MDVPLPLDADMAQELSIAGGGPAGLACGIRLLERGWAVTVHERGRYPLKKVCGGFLSPQAWQRLRDLGADRHLPFAPSPLRRARFYADAKSYTEFDLAPQAWGLRRSVLDSALAERFRELGGRLEEASEWQAGPDDGLVVDARGRGAGPKDGPWMAWKGYLPADAAPPEMRSVDLIMLPLEGAYAGLDWMDDGTVCVGLIGRRGQSVAKLLNGHPLLAAVAPWVKADSAISGFSLAARGGSLLLGDRRRVWPPLVGDGIHRALASGEALALSLSGQKAQGRAWDASPLQFGLALGLHYGMLSAWPRRLGLACLGAWPAMATKLYRWTRF
jgi:menaquinone-9 beta-reductase